MQIVATPATQLDTSAVRERVLEVIRTLLNELGSRGALPMLHLSSQLDRELGLGSLERVELLTRLEYAFGPASADQTRTPIASAIPRAPSCQGPARTSTASWALAAGSAGNG